MLKVCVCLLYIFKSQLIFMGFFTYQQKNMFYIKAKTFLQIDTTDTDFEIPVFDLLLFCVCVDLCSW